LTSARPSSPAATEHPSISSTRGPTCSSWSPARPPEGTVNLTKAQVGSFFDDPGSWPTKLNLDGFIYDSIEDRGVTVDDRISWLKRHQSGYAPQIYDQLAAAYRRAGRVADARQVSIAKQRCHGRELKLPGRAWSWVLYLTVGYGYRKWRAALWIIWLLVVGSIVFTLAYPVRAENLVRGSGQQGCSSVLRP
jgi:hypothetical protein